MEVIRMQGTRVGWFEAAPAFLVMTLLSGAPLAAQVADVPAPDTLGANFDISRPGTADADAFDFLIGEWNFRFQSRRGDGTYNPSRPGHWRVWKSHNGSMVEDEWSLEPTDTSTRRVTLTYRAWNPERKLWEMTGVVPGEGSFEPGLAWGTGDERMLVQHYGDYVTRIRYYAITPNHFLWRSDGSGDGGKTWVHDLWKMEATRVR
jgi:hypothetical protein